MLACPTCSPGGSAITIIVGFLILYFTVRTLLIGLYKACVKPKQPPQHLPKP